MQSKSILQFAPPTIGALAWLALALPASGQGLEHEYVTPAAGTSTQRFGYALAVDGDVMVAGAPSEDTQALNAGAAFVFRWDAVAGNWVEQQEMFASDPESLSGFGRTVAISGDVIVVGAPLEDNANGTDAGAVYVFRFDPVAGSWNEEQKIIEPGGGAYIEFGTSVGVSGTGLVIGSPKCDMSSGADAGCAYVYRWQSASLRWTAEVMLVDPYGGFFDHAGQAVAIESDVVLVSSPSSNEGGVKDAGAVVVWRKSGSVWSYDQRLTASHKTKSDQFGLSLVVKNSLVMIGSPLENSSSTLTDSGAAYVFRHDGVEYVEESRFTHPSPAAGQHFGSGVDIRDDLAVVGAGLDDTLGSDEGCVFTFRRARRAWAFDQSLGASDGAANDRLGGQVALNGSQILAAADGNDTASGSDWGVVYGYLAAEINLEITPSSPAAGAPLTITAFHGTPGDVVIIAATDVNGTPLFLPIFTDLFAADHAWTLPTNAPNPLFGIHVGLRAIKISEAGPIVLSDEAFVDV
jgi:hypothetical protein